MHKLCILEALTDRRNTRVPNFIVTQWTMNHEKLLTNRQYQGKNILSTSNLSNNIVVTVFFFQGRDFYGMVGAAWRPLLINYEVWTFIFENQERIWLPPIPNKISMIKIIY